MNQTIDAFLENKEIAIVGVSPRKENWGLMLMKELHKKAYKVYPVNPKYSEVEGVKFINSLSDLPSNVENVIIAVNHKLACEIIKQIDGTGIKRVWLNQGIGQGAYSLEAVDLLKQSKLEYVYGFCPMMFFGSGMHKFHFWIRKNLGKIPVEFSKN